MDGLLDELRAAAHAVWLRRWVALGVAWAICLVGWLAVSQIPNRYTSVARLSVQMRSILPAGSATGGVEVQQGDDLDRVRQTLVSAYNLDKVVRGTSLANTVANDRDLAERIGMLQNAIRIVAQQDNLFEISATLGDGRTAREVVQKMVDLFVADNLASGRDATSQSLRFLDQQLATRQRQLAEAEAKRQAFQAQFLNLLPGSGALDDRMSQAREQLAQIDADLAAANSSLSAVNGQLAATAATTAGEGGTASAGPARARVAAIEGQLAEGRGRGWTDQHPDMIALNRQLAVARAAARNEPVTRSGGTGAQANPLYLQLQSMRTERSARVAELAQRKGQIEAQLGSLQAKMAQDPAAAAEQAQLDQDIAAMKTQYDQLLADREQVRLRRQVQNETDAVKFSLIDPPSQPSVPTSPNRPLLLLAVLVAGIGGGVAVAFALGKLKSTFSTATRLERASGLPVIGSIGEVLTDAQRQLRARRLKLFVGATAALGVAAVALLGVEFAMRGLAAA
ncbi:XrtA system polysaccharide chain length determinant [Sphingomonas sp. ac-8]|uniref:XrtA system polysaccharide chain length determinant n=1 Tax=Sphingomonas sp. ac-8 TaxID=3242977 RepID=UPI003A7F73E2